MTDHKQNLTLVVEEDLLLAARKVALDQRTSVNQSLGFVQQVSLRRAARSGGSRGRSRYTCKQQVKYRSGGILSLCLLALPPLRHALPSFLLPAGNLRINRIPPPAEARLALQALNAWVQIDSTHRSNLSFSFLSSEGTGQPVGGVEAGRRFLSADLGIIDSFSGR